MSGAEGCDEPRGRRLPALVPVMGHRTIEVALTLFVATGHYRNGILLAPVTAAVMARCIVDGEIPDAIVPFLPARFSR